MEQNLVWESFITAHLKRRSLIFQVTAGQAESIRLAHYSIL